LSVAESGLECKEVVPCANSLHLQMHRVLDVCCVASYIIIDYGWMLTYKSDLVSCQDAQLDESLCQQLVALMQNETVHSVFTLLCCNRSD
jgi:hypothetical protein